MQRRDFIKLLSAAALTVAMPPSIRDSIVERTFGNSETLPDNITAGYIQVGPKRIVQWGQVILERSGAADVIFPMEMYSTLLGKALSSVDGEVVHIRTITPKSMRVFATPGARVLWVCLGETWGR